MIDPIIIVAIVSMFAAPIASWITWFLNRDKDKFAGTTTLITASGEAVDAMKDVLTTVREELERTKEMLVEMREQNTEMIKANETLLADNLKLHNDNTLLHAEMKKLREAVSELVEKQDQDIPLEQIKAMLLKLEANLP